jgi:copper chaperone CopZ
MKLLAASLFAASALVFTAQADVTVKISEVHLCCKKCVTGAEKAVGKVDGATVAVDKDAGTVTLTASDTATLQKAADSLVAAGYFGKSGDSSVTITSHTGATGAKVQSLEVSGVHLCCKKCATAVDNALKTVSGVKSETAEQGAKKFEVTGDFTDKDVFAALEKAGLTGKTEK